MLQSVETYCPECGQRMWRRPQSFLVNWNGPAPSQGDVAPAIKEHLRDRPRNLARNVEKYGTE